VPLGNIGKGDWFTFLIGLASIAVLFRRKVSNPLLIAATAIIGLTACSDSRTHMDHGSMTLCICAAKIATVPD
jgi:hypothetical protein